MLWRMRLDYIIWNFSNVHVTEKHVVGGLAPRGGHAPVSPIFENPAYEKCCYGMLDTWCFMTTINY